MKSGKKILIAYFTATNTTKKVAEQIQKILNCDIYQIEPEQKYTSNDLNWNDEKSRSTIEQKEKNQRPKIKKNKNPNIENYDIIFMILRNIFFCNDKQSLANLFCSFIDFSFIKNLPENKVMNFNDVFEEMAAQIRDAILELKASK